VVIGGRERDELVELEFGLFPELVGGGLSIGGGGEGAVWEVLELLLPPVVEGLGAFDVEEHVDIA